MGVKYQESINPHGTGVYFNGCVSCPFPLLCCRFFFGKNKVMMLALGKGQDDEYLDGLCNLSNHLHGETGLLFTNKKKAEVLK